MRVPSANSFKYTLLKLTQEETNLGARDEAGAAEKEVSLHAYSPGVQSSALQEWVVLYEAIQTQPKWPPSDCSQHKIKQTKTAIVISSNFSGNKIVSSSAFFVCLF